MKYSIKNQTATRPTGRAMLHERGITDAVIDRFQIRAGRHGWVYPIDHDIPSGYRFKAYPNRRGSKYFACDRNGKGQQAPENARFYDPTGELQAHIAAAGGVLILAAGEPDVWALATAGIFNVTCTMHAEAALPGWLVGELTRLGVVRVLYYPDRDRAGELSARKLIAALHDTPITLETYCLPGGEGSKYDINALLLERGAESLLTALQSCDVLTLPDTQPEPHTPRHTPRIIPDDTASLWEQWCSELDRAVPGEWKRGKVNQKGYHKNVACPFHEEDDPSAGYNGHTVTVKCFVCGEHNQHDIAALIGFQSWEDYKAMHAPALDLPRPVMKRPEAEPERDPDHRVGLWHWTDELRRKLVGLYAETDERDRPKYPALTDMRALVMVLEILIEAEHDRVIEPGATLAERDVLALCEPRGVTRHTVQAAIQHLEQGGIICRKSPRERTYKNPLGDSQQIIKSRGKRGPAAYFMLLDQDTALDNFVNTLRDNSIRVAAFAPPLETAITPDNPRTDEPYSLLADDLHDAEQRRAPLYDRFAADRARAEKHIFTAARVLRRALADASARHLPTAERITDETPNKTAYSDALDDLRFMSMGRVRVEPDKQTRLASGLRNTQQLQRSRERRGIVTIKRHKRHTIHGDLDALEQVPDYTVKRGWGLRLEASNGETFEVTHKTQGYAQRWVDRQFEGGATVKALEQIASSERPADVQEQRRIEAKIEDRKERQRAAREQRKHQDIERAERSPAPPETPLNRHPEYYARKQAMLGLEEFTAYRMAGDTLISVITGRKWKEPTAAQLWRAWAGTLEDIQGATMPTFAAHNHPEDAPLDVTAEFEDMSAARERERRQSPPAAAAMVSEPSAAAETVHACCICKAPAETQMIGAWYCEKHACMSASEVVAETRQSKALAPATNTNGGALW